MEEGDDSSSEAGFQDPEPALPPPPWAAALAKDARARSGREVYPPSDDTYLMLEAFAEDAPMFAAMQPRICLEIGCGSGALSAGLLAVLRGESSGGSSGSAAPLAPLAPPPLMLVVDKNPEAAACAAGLLRARHAERADVLRCSLTSCLRMVGLVDVLVCNPPYVPTEDPEEMRGSGVSISWAGGERGREVIDRLLPEAAAVMAAGGVFYLVCIAENDPEELMATMRGLGLDASVAKREQRGIEELFILRFRRPPADGAGATSAP